MFSTPRDARGGHRPPARVRRTYRWCLLPRPAAPPHRVASFPASRELVALASGGRRRLWPPPDSTTVPGRRANCCRARRATRCLSFPGSLYRPRGGRLARLRRRRLAGATPARDLKRGAMARAPEQPRERRRRANGAAWKRAWLPADRRRGSASRRSGIAQPAGPAGPLPRAGGAQPAPAPR